jgi:hypothetical protein
MEIVTIDLLSSQAEYQQYKPADTSLINTATIAPPFGAPTDYVEYFIYDINGDLLVSEYYDTNYTPVNPDPATGNYTALQIDPQADVASHGYDRGSVDITYNFFRTLFQSSYTNQFWIKQISGTRTELKVCRQDLSNQQLQQAFTDFENQAASRAYYSDFYLNFGNNEVLIGVNVAYALDGDQGCLLLKLYEPLPADIDLKSTFWIVEQLGDSVKYQVTVEVPASAPPSSNALKGPNFNLNIAQRVGQATPTYNLSTLLASSSLAPSSSLYQQMQSILQDTSIDINVDYSDFSNFVHFSSAQERIYNFAYKLKLIESYNQSIANAGTVLNGGTITSGSILTYQQQINNIITNFDGYEYYLYYENTPQAWPKSNSLPPYQLYSITSSQALTWLGNPDVAPPVGQYSALNAASTYDLNNKDWLINTIPEYLKQDDSNIPYQTFLNMIGQHFDNIWIYYKDVTERYDAESDLTKGVSKEIVKSALESFGIHLYTNTNISDNLYYSTLGINPDGSLTPPTGSFNSNNIYITYNSSGPYVFLGYTNPNLYTLNFDEKPTIPGADITLEYQKRIYHNLPYLLKTRGTTRGLRALINCFGIPSTLLRINEFGGSDKLQSTPDVIQKRYGLAYHNSGSVNLTIPWALQVLNNAVPDTIEFRFKTQGIPDSNHISQSLFEVNRGNNTYFGIQLTYDSASAIPSSSLQNNGNLTFYLNNSGSAGIYGKTAPITLPFFDNTQWWSVSIGRATGSAINTVDNTYTLTVAGTAYNQEGDGNITYLSSSSLFVTSSTSASYNASWNAYDTSTQTALFSAYLGGPVNLTSSLCKLRTTFQGYYQEFRYWGQPLSLSAFNQHVTSPSSIVGNTPTSSYTDLTFRLPLGNNNVVPSYGTSSLQLNSPDGDLYEIGYTAIDQSAVLTSNHPAASTVKSFKSGSSSFSYGLFGSGSHESESNASFESLVMTDLIAGPSVGVGQKVNNKIFIPTQDDLTESLLSPFVSIQRYNPDISRNSADIEVGFSPSDLVDADITNQLGYFNIDDYIGNPADAYLSNYPDLDTLRNTYFQKYISKFDLPDFINLIRFFDNSLFKMIKDFVPARADLSTGIIVKPHILERSKYPRNEPTVTISNNTSSVDLVDTSGSNPEGYYLNTRYTQSVPVSFYVAPGNQFQTIQPLSVGNITSPQSKLKEPFTGEFGGLDINLTNHGQFSQLERSSITAPWTSSIKGGQSIFTTYNLGGLYNNAVYGVTSSIYLKTDYSSNLVVPVNNGIITQYYNDIINQNPTNYFIPFATITDSNYSSKVFTGIRYTGTKTTSVKYNTYTVGDSSYGKTAAIDRNSVKIGLFTQVQSSSLLPGRVNTSLKYLVDANGNLTELNQQNNNLFEVQNIFKAGGTATISLFDRKKYSNQKFTDGVKPIFTSGYSYEPIMYFGDSNADSTLSFLPLNPSSYLATATTVPNPNRYISGSGTGQNSFPVSGGIGGYVNNVFNSSAQQGTLFFTGSSTVGSYYLIPETGNYNVDMYVELLLTSSTPLTITWQLELFNSSSNSVLATSSPYQNSVAGTAYQLYDYTFGNTGHYSRNITAYRGSGTSPTASFLIPSGVQILAVDNPGYTDVTLTSIVQRTDPNYGFTLPPGVYVVSSGSATNNPKWALEGGSSNVTVAMTLTTTLFAIPKNTKIVPRLKLVNSTLTNYTASIIDSQLSIASQATVSGYTNATLSHGYQDTWTLGTVSSSIILNPALSSFYGDSYIFAPNPTPAASASAYPSSSLYKKYGDVNYIFKPQINDIIVANYSDGTFGEYVIQNIYIDNLGQLNLIPSVPLGSIAVDDFNNDTFVNFLIVKKIPDETNLELTFNKPPGLTSYGFVIPDDLDFNFLRNIDTITAGVKQKLLASEQGTTSG